MIDLSESNKSVYGFLSFTVEDVEIFMLINSPFTFRKKLEEKLLDKWTYMTFAMWCANLFKCD